MIFKALFISFLSLQLPCLVSAQATPTPVPRVFAEVDFDKLPEGRWDENTVVNGSVKFEAPRGGLRVYNLTRSLPQVPLRSEDTTHAIGNFPFGTNLTVRFVGGALKSSISFAYVAGGRLQDVAWRADGYFQGERQLDASGASTGGRWQGTPGFRGMRVDELRLYADVGPRTRGFWLVGGVFYTAPAKQ